MLSIPSYFLSDYEHRIIVNVATQITRQQHGLGVGRHPRTGRKKGGLKVHSVIHANEGVHSDVQFTSAATNDSFMLKPKDFGGKDILAFDRAYINYEKMEELTRRGVIYVTKMKKSLVFCTLLDCINQGSEGLMHTREQIVVFDEENTGHIARIVTYVDQKKGRQPKLVSLLTNDFDMDAETIIFRLRGLDFALEGLIPIKSGD